MQNITATLINIFHVCHRELWLHANEIRMEHTSEIVAEGRFIGETAYDRRADKYTQVEFDGVKIDFFDAKNKIVHETKRGRAVEQAHRAQVQYYLYKLQQHGVPGVSGLIEYPDLRRVEPVAALTDADYNTIAGWETEVERIVSQPDCPPPIHAAICKNCSYYDFCYAAED